VTEYVANIITLGILALLWCFMGYMIWYLNTHEKGTK
jgi:cbb3-type cytochrome oxidase subunit 3